MFAIPWCCHHIIAIADVLCTTVVVIITITAYANTTATLCLARLDIFINCYRDLNILFDSPFVTQTLCAVKLIQTQQMDGISMWQGYVKIMWSHDRSVVSGKHIYIQWYKADLQPFHDTIKLYHVYKKAKQTAHTFLVQITMVLCRACDRWSLVIGCTAFVWLMFTSLIFTLPAVSPITRLTFNYTPVAIGGVILMITLVWLFSARHWFAGPKLEVDNSDIVRVKYWISDPPRYGFWQAQHNQAFILSYRSINAIIVKV